MYIGTCKKCKTYTEIHPLCGGNCLNCHNENTEKLEYPTNLFANMIPENDNEARADYNLSQMENHPNFIDLSSGNSDHTPKPDWREDDDQW